MIEESPALPEVINDRYRVLKLLGQGGMGQVFLVDDLHRKGQRMALKTLLPQTTDRLLTSGFRDEFAELAKLEHPHLARAYDFGRISKSSEYFFTTEFVQGVELMKGVRDATVNQLVNISSQILRGLDFIHRNGILHNDLKPANILLASEAHGPAEGGPDGAARPRGDGLNRLESLVTDHRGQVKIIDFGLISREHTAWDKILGTLRYISPERILCKKADRRSDLYSIGIVFYVLFTHRVPFAASDPKLILRQHLEQAPNPVQKYRPDLPEFVPRFIHKLLEKKPEDRFPSGEEVLGFIGQAMGWETPAEVIPSASWKGGRLTAGTLLHRNPEIDALRERFDAAREGTRDSHAMIVEGPSGVGKTRLVEELRGYVQVSEGVFVAVSGSDVGGDLQPVAEALLSGLQTRGVSGLQEARSRLEFAKAREGNLLQALEKLLLWFTKNSPLLLHFDDFDRASKTVRRFVLELLCAADARSREGDKPCRLFIVVSRRSASGTGDLGISNVPSIELVNFSDQESRTFVRSVFGQDDIPEPVLATLARSSEGNPLFLLELANKLVDGKQARFSGARWQFPSSLEGIELPDTLDHLFEEKLESLTKQALDVLSWVAVAGRPLAENVLRRCASSGEKLLGGHLEQLCSKNLLEAKTLEDGSQEVQLTYWGIRDRLVEQLGEERLKLFHQRLAQNIEEEFPDWEDRADALAQHWKEAGNEAGFLRFAPQAAELLRTRGDLETAVSYRRRIVDAMPETALAKKIQSLAKLSEMHEVLWDLESCHQDLLEIQTLGGKLMKPAEQALLLRRIASVEMAMFRYERADQRLEEASRVLSQAPPLHRLSIDAPRAITLRFTGKHDEARELLARTASSLAEPPANEPKQKMLHVGAANHVATLYQQTGELEKATELYTSNLALLAGAEQKQALGATHCALGSVLLERGDYDEAAGHLKEALRIGKETGDRRTLCRARDRLGDYHLRFGRFREALQVAQLGLEDAKTIDNLGAVSNSLRTLGRIYLTADEARHAEQTFKRALSVHEESGDAVSRGLSRLQLARFYLDVGDNLRARKHLDASRPDVESLGLPLLEGLFGLWSFVCLWREKGEYDKVGVDRALATFTRHGYHGELLDLLLAHSEVEIGALRYDEARTILENIRELTQEHRRPDLANEVSFILGRIYLRTGRESDAQTLLDAVRRRARDQHKLRLARLCEESLRGVTAQA